MAVFGVKGKPTRFYHGVTPESMVRLTVVAEELVAGGTWTASPWNVPTGSSGDFHIGWNIKPYRW
jgi:hypothetical protein